MRPPILKVENVSKAFGGLKAVDAASLDVREGEILGLIGPNGAGKTTLFNLMSRQLGIDSGKIYFHGSEIQGLKSFQVARLGIARTFQVVRPFPRLTCEENVRLGFLISPESGLGVAKKIRDLLALVRLEREMTTPAHALTLMEKKKLEIARALATSPQLLLLDEVMSGLNPREIDEAVELVLTLRKERKLTVVWVEHVMRAIMTTADRIAVLHQGRVLKLGVPGEIKADPEVIEVYLGSGKHA